MEIKNARPGKGAHRSCASVTGTILPGNATQRRIIEIVEKLSSAVVLNEFDKAFPPLYDE